MISALINEQSAGSNKRRQIVAIKHRTFQNTSEIEIRRMFTVEQDDEKILTASYAADTWRLLDRYKDQTYSLNFKDLPYAEELKAFTVCYLEHNQPVSAANAIRFIIKVLHVTNGLTEEIRDIKSVGKYSAYNVDLLTAFVSFIELKPSELRVIYEVLEKNQTERSEQSRPLPVFQSVMLFQQIVDDFAVRYLKDMPAYYPIVLWWKLTMIIPMRPIEFFQLKTSDFYISDGEYMMHLIRSPKSGEQDDRHRIPLISEFRIDQDIYYLFQHYIDTIDPGEQGFIFNSNGIKTAIDREFMGRNRLDFLQDQFFDDIVAGVYKQQVIEKETTTVLEKGQIERINYGDTRHLAFMNLILSGMNPYTIAQLGGHRQLSTQNYYYNGLTAYCTSKAYSLAYGIVVLEDANMVTVTDFRKNELLKNTTDLSSCRRIENGYCTSRDFPYECGSADCSSGECPYHISDNIADIKEKKKLIQEDITRKVSVLKSIIYKEPNDSVEREETANSLQEDIVKLARLLQCEQMSHKENV